MGGLGVGLDAEDVIVVVAFVRSKVTAEPSVVLVRCAPAFASDDRSVKSMVIAIAPSVSVALMVRVTVHAVSEELAIVVLAEAMVEVTELSSNPSLAVIVVVTTSPAFAQVVLALFEVMVTTVRYGFWSSRISVDALCATVVFEFPAASETPSASTYKPLEAE